MLFFSSVTWFYGQDDCGSEYKKCVSINRGTTFIVDVVFVYGPGG